MTTSALIDQILPQEIFENSKLRSISKEIALTASGVAAIAALAQLALPLPFTPVPITGQTLAVLLIGASYGSWRALRTTAAYLATGALGLPVFAKAASGLGALTGATGGYLLGFLVAAFIMGFIAERGYFRKIKSAVPLFLLGHACIFACGMAVLGMFTGYDKVVALGLVPFLPGLVIKTLAAGLILPSLHKLVD